MNPPGPNERGNEPGAKGHSRPLDTEQLRAVWVLYQAVSEASPARRGELLKTDTLDPLVAKEVLAMLEKGQGPVVPPSAEERSGQKIGRFLVKSRIGRGGMAEVYLARDTELDRDLALKFLPIGNRERGLVDRSIREARAASAVNHPNIVTIYEVINTETDLVIAMELIDGVPLRQFCGKPQPIRQVLSWGQQIAAALAAVHTEGIMHLDLKPENIMSRRDGFLKILDFGLARFVEQDLGSQSGRQAGTLRYMAPEQFLSGAASKATDVFALGLVLYELCTGEHPFAADTLFQTATAIANAQPPLPSSKDPLVPSELDSLLLSMLEKEGNHRPSAAQVAETLARLRNSLGHDTVNPSAVTAIAVNGPKPAASLQAACRRGLTWLAGGAVAACVLGAGFFFAARAPSPPKADPRVVWAPGLDDAIPPRHLYAVNSKGGMVVYVDDSTETSGYRWPVEGVILPPLEGVNWASFRKVFAGGDGVIYALTGNGLLKYFRLIDPWRNSGPLHWSADSNTVVGAGWSRIRDAAAMSRPVWASAAAPAHRMATSLLRGGYIWAAEDSGKPFLLQHGWAAGGRPSATMMEADKAQVDYSAHFGAPSLPPNHACAGCSVLEGGDGIVYAVSKGGVLWRYRVRAGGDWAKPTGQASRDLLGVEIGHGWHNYSPMMAAPGAYSIDGYVSTENRAGTGVVSTMSVFAGDPVKVRVSTFSPVYTLRLIRLQRRLEGMSGLIDGRQEGDGVTRRAPAGGNFKKPQDSGMSVSGAGWLSDGPDPRIPVTALPGYYAAELTTPSGGRALAPFIVKPPPNARPRHIAVLANTMTWNASNQWGGHRHLLGPLEDGAANEVSFERPLLETPVLGGASTSPGLVDRNPLAFNQLVRAEVWVASWLDSLAARDARYSYDVFTDVDLDAGIPHLNDYKVLLIHTLPQYWTDRMRDNLDNYLNSGGHVVYLAGKGIFQRVSLTAEGRMRMSTAADSRCAMPAEGPSPLPANPCPTIELFRWSDAGHPDGRSERSVLGLAFEPSLAPLRPSDKGNYFVVGVAHPFLVDGTGLKVGSPVGKVTGLSGMMAAGWGPAWHLPGALYREFKHKMGTATHATLAGVELAQSAGEPHASIVYRDAGAGAWVFSIGATPVGGVLAVDPVLQRIVTNALDAAITGVAPR